MVAEPVRGALDQLGPPAHFCAIYEDPSERFAVSLPFIHAGLQRGEKCLYIGEDGAEASIRAALEAGGIDVERGIATGALVIASKEHSYMRQGVFDPQRVLDFWQQTSGGARNDGFSALRAVGETDWIAKGAPGLERWMEYESRLTHALQQCNAMVLCSYRRPLFPPELILGVIRAHASVVHGGVVCQNHYYVPPEEFLRENHVDREVVRLLASLREREQAEGALRRQAAELRVHHEDLRFIQDELAAQLVATSRMHADLTRSEAYLAEAQRISQTGSWAWDAASGELFWSQEHFRIFGLEGQGQPKHEQAVDMIHPEDRPGAVAEWEQATRERRAFQTEFRVVRPDGSICHALSVGRPVLDGSGVLKEYIGTLMDVTQRREAERMARESNEELELILGSITEHFFAFSRDWRYTYFNSAAARQMRELGFDPAATIGKVLWEVFPDVPNEQAIRRVMTERVPVTDEVYLAPLGQWVENHMYPRRDGGIVIFQRYITDRKRAEEALRKAREELAHVNRALTVAELTASIAHELNQPLAAVVANANACERWLIGPPPDMDEAMASLARITRDANRASGVISRIRGLLTRNTTARIGVSMDDLVREVIELLQGEMHARNVTVLSTIARGVPRVTVDRVQFQQVLLNLALNGIDAIARSPVRSLDVRVDTWPRGGVVVSVRDSGVGLAPGTAERVFDAFFTTKPGGMGMGLAISRSIVEAHGGRLWAEQAEGGGAVFRFTVPQNTAP